MELVLENALGVLSIPWELQVDVVAGPVTLFWLGRRGLVEDFALLSLASRLEVYFMPDDRLETL